MRQTTVALLLSLLFVAACVSTNRLDLSGMSFSDEPLTGKFIWYDLVTEDAEAARRFYAGLFGWTIEQASRPDMGEYYVARDGDVYVAGIVPTAPRDDVDVSRWLPYLSVDDVDDAVATSVRAGATVVVGARNVSLGRVAAIIDPEGAVLGLARSELGDPDDATTRPAPGRTIWTELLANDPDLAARFYETLAGYEARVIERRGGEYTLLTAGGVERAGILEKPSPEIASTWLTHFGVRDPAAAAARAESLGGRIVLPVSPEFRDGTMAIITDPSGAVLVLHKI